MQYGPINGIRLNNAAGSIYPMRIECIENRASLAGLKEPWDSLANTLKYPLLGFDWVLSCIGTIHANDRTLVFILRDDNDSIVAIAPMILTKRHGLPHLLTSGANSLFEPGGVLYSDELHLDILLKGIARHGFPVTLYRLFTNNDIRSLPKKMTLIGSPTVTSAMGLPSLYIELPDKWEDFLNGISSRRRYDHRRSRKRSMEVGTVDFKCITPTPDNVEDVLLSAYKVESSGWKGKNGSGLLNKKVLFDFFMAYGRKSSYNGLLKVFFLSVDSQNIASQIAIQAYNKLWILKIGYDEAWEKHSPGIQLTMECIHYAIENGLSSYEFLGSAEDWVRIWANRERDYKTITAYPFSWFGLAGLSIDMASHAAGLGVRRTKALSNHLLSSIGRVRA